MRVPIYVGHDTTEIAELLLPELGYSNDAAPSPEIIADAGEDLSYISNQWAEELFSDAVGVCVFGPAYIVSYSQAFPPTGRTYAASKSHPPDATRYQFMLGLLRSGLLGDFAGCEPPSVSSYLGELEEFSARAVQRIPGTQQYESDIRLYRCALSAVDRARQTIWEYAVCACDGILYTPEQYTRDLRLHSPPLGGQGVPPVAAGAQGCSFATIINVATSLEPSIPATRAERGDWDEEERFDELLSKAIELSEFQTTWSEGLGR